MTAYQVADLTASTHVHHRCVSHTQIGRCRMCTSQQMLNELPIIFEVTGRCFTAWFTAPRGGLCSIPFSRAVVQMPARPWHGAAGRIEHAFLYTKPSTTPPARAWAGRHHPGVVGEPAAGCIPSVPPVGGWGRLGASSWPQIRRWDRRRCCWRVSGPPGGPEIRWGLSVGWCPSKRVVVIHCARPYTAQKVSGGCVTAISGSVPKFAEDT